MSESIKKEEKSIAVESGSSDSEEKSNELTTSQSESENPEILPPIPDAFEMEEPSEKDEMTDLKAGFESHHDKFVSSFIEPLQHAYQAGLYLIALKKKVKADDGKWLDWMEKNYPKVNIRTAQRYMALARNNTWEEVKIKSESYLKNDEKLLSTSKPTGFILKYRDKEPAEIVTQLKDKLGEELLREVIQKGKDLYLSNES